MNAMYCAEQIEVPPELGLVLKLYTKAAIRAVRGPETDLLKWSANYFAEASGIEQLPFNLTDGTYVGGGGVGDEGDYGGHGLPPRSVSTSHGSKPPSGGAMKVGSAGGDGYMMDGADGFEPITGEDGGEGSNRNAPDGGGEHHDDDDGLGPHGGDGGEEDDGDDDDVPSVEAVVAHIFHSYANNSNSSDGAAATVQITDLPSVISDLKVELGLDITDEQIEDFVSGLPTDESGGVTLDVFRSAFFQSPDNSPDRAGGGGGLASSVPRSPGGRNPQ